MLSMVKSAYFTYIDDTILHGPTMYYYPNGNLLKTQLYFVPTESTVGDSVIE